MNGHPHHSYSGSNVDARVTAGDGYTLSVTVIDGAGDPVDADAGVDLTLNDGTGSSVQTEVQSNNTGTTGEYTFELVAPETLELYRAKLTWTVNGIDYSSTEGVDVVGEGRPSSLERILLVINNRLPSGKKVSASEAQRVRQVCEDYFTGSMGFPPYARGLRTEQSVDRQQAVRIRGAAFPRKLVSVEVYDRQNNLLDQYSTEDFDLRNRKLRMASGRNLPADAHLKMLVEHGFPLGRDMDRAFEQFVQHVGTPQNMPERTTEVSDQGVVYSLSIPSVGRPTGIPEADAVINRYRLGTFL